MMRSGLGRVPCELGAGALRARSRTRAVTALGGRRCTDSECSERRSTPGADGARDRVERWLMRDEQAQRARWAAVRAPAADAAVAVLAVAVAAVGSAEGPRGERLPLQAVLVLLAGAGAALLWRRSIPLVVWAATSMLTAAMVLAGGTQQVLAAPVLVALYTVGRSVTLRTTTVCALVTGALYTIPLALRQGVWLDERGDAQALPVLALIGAAAAIGVAVRSQRDALEAARERALQAEATREEEAERRVTDERLRIARELHDVVAHHISVINVQAGVARHLMDTRPDQARAALSAVRDASKTVLTEMTAVVGLLRSEDGSTPAEPAPGLHRLPALVESLGSAGLGVAWRTSGQVRELPPIADLAAYRVVQEALTNALKHGTGTADLLIHHDPQEVVIEVRNPVAGASASSPPDTSAGGQVGQAGQNGHGLVGMRERLEAVSGRLSAGAHGSSWLVRAAVPRTSRSFRSPR